MTVGAPLTDEQRLDWLRLIRSENVGPRTFSSLLRHYGSVRAALDALPELARRGGAARAIRICSRADAAREMEAARGSGASFVCMGEPAYPVGLAAIDDAPPVITVRGQVSVLTRPTVAMVGSRNASAAGLKFAGQLARELGEAGFVIASGLARGIDAAAHRASLDSGTVAVLAGGHDRIYPNEHVGLLGDILGAGAAVSEMPFGWEPRARDFPRRNRIVSGLALGVVIVEAAKRSGSLITARLALEQGREVFAVPGSPIDPRAEGTNGLLKQGATLVTETADVVTALEPILGHLREPAYLSLDNSGDKLLAEPDGVAREGLVALLSPAPVAIDDLVRLSGTSAATVRTIVFELELAGRIERHAGGHISIR